LTVFQPNNLRAEADLVALEALQADLMVVVAYGLLLPARVLAAPRLGCVNIHASLLPRWRGAAPIQRALLAGDAETGITIMQMDEGLDTGPMLHRLRCPIGSKETGGELHDRLSELGARALMEALPGIAAGSLTPEPQDAAGACYARKLDKAEASIDWARSAPEIERQVRAFNPWPVAQTGYAGKVLRIWEAKALPGTTGDAPGQVLASGRAGIEVATGDGRLLILRLQLPGKKALTAGDFVNAHDLQGAAFA
jgi:methionyl-tRNA formyltransferase